MGIFLVLEDEQDVAVLAMALASAGAMATGSEASGDLFIANRIAKILSAPVFEKFRSQPKPVLAPDRPGDAS